MNRSMSTPETELDTDGKPAPAEERTDELSEEALEEVTGGSTTGRNRRPPRG
jgi:hypothetical protein